MYSKIIFLVILNCVLALAKDNCNCTSEEYDQAVKESNDIVQFLNMLAGKGLTDEQRFPDVNPGMITGAFGCDCSENLRKKRKVFPDESIRVRAEQGLSGGALQSGKKRCPKGYVRIATACIPVGALI